MKHSSSKIANQGGSRYRNSLASIFHRSLHKLVNKEINHVMVARDQNCAYQIDEVLICCQNGHPEDEDLDGISHKRCSPICRNSYLGTARH